MGANKKSYFGSKLFFRHVVIGTYVLIVLTLTLVLAYFIRKTIVAQNAYEILNEKYEKLDNDNQDVLEPPTELSYQGQYKDLYTQYPATFNSTEEKTLYLTFDDGPSPVTQQVLTTLAQYNVKATFFVMGSQLDSIENQAILKRIVNEGHTVGIHTTSHDYGIIYNSVDSYLADFYTTWNAVKEISGYECTIFRFPGGSINTYNASIYQQIIAEMTRRGFVYFDWNVSSEDATKKIVSIQEIVDGSLTGLSNQRAFLLMHDSATKENSALALPTIIDTYLANGYVIEPLNNEVNPITFSYTH